MSAVRVLQTRWVFVFGFVRVGKKHAIIAKQIIIKSRRDKTAQVSLL